MIRVIQPARLLIWVLAGAAEIAKSPLGILLLKRRSLIVLGRLCRFVRIALSTSAGAITGGYRSRALMPFMFHDFLQESTFRLNERRLAVIFCIAHIEPN